MLAKSHCLHHHSPTFHQPTLLIVFASSQCNSGLPQDLTSCLQVKSHTNIFSKTSKQSATASSSHAWVTIYKHVIAVLVVIHEGEA